jgi:hypothetical protein
MQNQDKLAQKTHHLIMVAGHSVTISGNLEEAGVDESVWYVPFRFRRWKPIDALSDSIEHYTFVWCCVIATTGFY